MRPGVQIFCAVLWNLLAAGPIFGFAALKPVLVSQGVYSDVCPIDECSCAAQDMKLNFMFTVSAGVTNIVALLVGFILDYKGPRVCGYIGSAFLAIGSVLLAASDSIHLFDPYISGYVMLAIGGPFVFISTFQLSNSIPKHSGKILSALTGAFDTSSALFMFYRIYYQNVSEVSLRTFFSYYLVVPAFIVFCETFVMPRDSYASLGATQKLNVEGLTETGDLPEGMQSHRDYHDINENMEAMQRRLSLPPAEPPAPDRRDHPTRISYVSDRRRKSILEEVVGHKLQVKTKGVYGVLHGQSVKAQLRSPWFIYVLLLTVICMLRLNYFMATVRSQESYLLGRNDAAEDLGSIFDVALPFGGLIAIPLTGVFLDNLSTLTILTIMCICSIAIGVLGLFPSFSLNLIGILLLVVYRPFYYTVISDYCTKVFGFETFGTVYGLVMSTAGVLNMSQAVIDALTHSFFHMNPTPLNALMTALTVVIAALMLRYVSREVKNLNRPHLSEDSPLLSDSAIV